MPDYELTLVIKDCFLILMFCYAMFSGRSVSIVVTCIQRLLTWLENLSEISLILEKYVNSKCNFFERKISSNPFSSSALKCEVGGGQGEGRIPNIPLHWNSIRFFGFLSFVAVYSASLWREQTASSHIGLSHNFTHNTKYLMHFGSFSLSRD